MGIKQIALNEARDLVTNAVVTPVRGLVDDSLKDIVTTVGSFIVRSIRGKFQRSITFTVGVNYYDQWMEEALYGILYEYNNISNQSRLELQNHNSTDGSGMYYQLDDGTHNLKYREYDILLAIQTNVPTTPGRIRVQRIYTIITYNLSEKFVKDFERDMLAHRNSLLKIKKDSPVVTLYQDHHESDGYTYWEKLHNIPKRRLSTIYLPHEQKKRIVDTINEFFASKEYYRKHGIAHNLKILLYGPPGPQPVSTPIPTPDGMMRFGDLKIGDMVFDHNGNPTEVIHIFNKGVQDVYEVEFLNGRKTRCTIDHLWKVQYRSHGKWKEDVYPLGYIIDNSQQILLADGSIALTGEKRFSVQTNGAAKFNDNQVSIDPYVMGIIITNGCLTDKYFRISEPTDEIPERVASIMGWCVQKRSDDPTDYSYIFYDCDGNRIRTSDVLRDYPELIGVKSYDLEIPKNYLFNSVDSRLALLSGLMDGDGSIVERSDRLWTSPTISYTTTSVTLSRQFMLLCRSLGFDCLAHPDMRDKYTSGFCTSITLQVDPRDMPKLFRTSYKLYAAMNSMSTFYELKDVGEIPWNKYHDKSKIVRVRKLPVQEKVMCIKVSSEDHLYLTEDFIVTHNSGKDSIARMIASEWNRNIYYVTGGKDSRFIPNAITDTDEDVCYPLLLISDIDKHPYLISEPDINIDDPSLKDERIKQKQIFGEMINALDGVLSAEDRIIVMTTNHIEKFSDTFLRDGRVDLKEEIGYVTPEVFRKYIHDFYEYDLPDGIELVDKQLTVAKLQKDVVFRKMNLDEIVDKHVVRGNNSGKK